MAARVEKRTALTLLFFDLGEIYVGDPNPLSQLVQGHVAVSHDHVQF